MGLIRRMSIPHPALPPRALMLELIGMACVLTGVGLIYVPAALIVGGLTAVYVAIGLNDDAPAQ